MTLTYLKETEQKTEEFYQKMINGQINFDQYLKYVNLEFNKLGKK